MLYEDDIVLFAKFKCQIDEVVELLGCHFDLKILGKTRKLLGVEFEEIDGCQLIRQQSYIDEICKKYSKYHFLISTLPISKGVVFLKSQCPQTNTEMYEMSKYPYRNMLSIISC